jgi:hypothetical protein
MDLREMRGWEKRGLRGLLWFRLGLDYLYSLLFVQSAGWTGSVQSISSIWNQNQTELDFF